jgi:hypothetical protein
VGERSNHLPFVIARVIPQVVPKTAGWRSIFFTTGLFRDPANCGPATCGIAMTNKKYLQEHFSSIEYFFQFLQIAVYKLSVVIIKNS